MEEHSTLNPQIKGSNPEKSTWLKTRGTFFFVELPISLPVHREWSMDTQGPFQLLAITLEKFIKIPRVTDKHDNRTAHIRHLCRKTTVLSCHRCLINTGVETNEQHLNID